ncbi:MAG: DUF6488 family protein [Bdellovibrionota bacterium]
MKLYLSLFVIVAASVLLASKVVAHPGGHGGGPPQVVECEKPQDCSQEEVQKAVTRILPLIVQSNELPPEWAKIPDKDITVGPLQEPRLPGGHGWLTTIRNELEVKEDKKTLYFVISKDGYFLGMTYERPVPSDGRSNPQSANNNRTIYFGITLVVVLSGLAFFIMNHLSKKKSNSVDKISSKA